MTRVLFVCGKARSRSPTAAQVFAERGYSTDFGGLSRDADDALSADQIEWAEHIFVMDNRQLRRLMDQFPGPMRGKRVVTLGIPDLYTFMQDDLVDLLLTKAGPHLEQGRRR